MFVIDFLVSEAGKYLKDDNSDTAVFLCSINAPAEIACFQREYAGYSKKHIYSFTCDDNLYCHISNDICSGKSDVDLTTYKVLTNSDDFIRCALNKRTLQYSCRKAFVGITSFRYILADDIVKCPFSSYSGVLSSQQYQNLFQSSNSDNAVKSVKVIPVDPSSVSNYDNEISSDDFDYLELKECYKVVNDANCEIICIDNKASEYRYSCGSGTQSSSQDNNDDNSDYSEDGIYSSIPKFDSGIDKSLLEDKDFNIFEKLYGYANNLTFIKALRDYNPFANLGGGCCKFTTTVFGNVLMINLCDYHTVFEGIGNVLVFIAYFLSVVIIVRKI